MGKIDVMKKREDKKVEGIQEKKVDITSIDRFVNFEVQHFIH